MNRIIVNNDTEIQSNVHSLLSDKIVIKEDTSIFLELLSFSKKVTVDVKENCQVDVVLLGESINFDLEIYVSENSSLIFRTLVFNGNGEVSAYLNGTNSSVQYIYSSLVDVKSNLKFSVYHNALRTSSNFIGNSYSLNDAGVIFDVNGYVKKESSGCVCLQDSKILTLNSKTSKIYPNLYIDNYDVEASHSAYIGSFSSEELFYLMSRGISKLDSYQLLIQSFLLGKMELCDQEKNRWIEKIGKWIGRESQINE